MESNKHNFQTIKESLCNVLDAVNEENTSVKQQIALLVEENRGLKQEVGSLIEKVNILVSLIDELKNNSKNFTSQVQEDVKDNECQEKVYEGEYENESEEEKEYEDEKECEYEESLIEDEFEDEFVDEPMDERIDEPIDETIEDSVEEQVEEETEEEPLVEPMEEQMDESIDETIDEPIEDSIENLIKAKIENSEAPIKDTLEAPVEEFKERVPIVEEVSAPIVEGLDIEKEPIAEEVDNIVDDVDSSEVADSVEYAEAAEVDYKKENIYREAEDSYKEDEISFELDLQEMESEEVVQELEIEEPVAPAPKILHEASKPDWYDWEVDYPAPYVEDIQDGIGFNDKILFIRELFNEDDERFAQTIENLNKFERFKSAIDYIRENFPDWDEQEDVVYRFYMSVRRKLRK